MNNPNRIYYAITSGSLVFICCMAVLVGLGYFFGADITYDKIVAAFMSGVGYAFGYADGWKREEK